MAYILPNVSNSLKTQFKIDNSINHHFKNSKKLKNLAKLPITNNKEDLTNTFKNEDLLDDFMIKRQKSDHAKKKQKEAHFLKTKIEELSGIVIN